MVKSNLRMLLFLVLVLSGCNSAGTTQVIQGTASDASFTSWISVTEQQPTAMLTASTPSVTPTSTETPTIGPPPDLELINVTIYPETTFELRQRYYFMGKIRNNTDSIMLFTSKFVALRFNFDVWEYDKVDKEGSSVYDYFHMKFTHDIWPVYDHNFRSMNCFLFPGEEGVLFFDFNYTDAPDEDRGYFVEKYDGPIGLWYSYESYYETNPNIPSVYRIPAENIYFRKVEDVVEYGFDVDLSEKHIFYKGISFDHSAWVLLYDKDGKIINVYYRRINDYPGYYENTYLHVASSTGLVNTNNYYFRPLIKKMTPEMVERTDRIEVITEIEEAPICSTNY
jgi:hypothetical protein